MDVYDGHQTYHNMRCLFGKKKQQMFALQTAMPPTATVGIKKRNVSKKRGRYVSNR